MPLTPRLEVTLSRAFNTPMTTDHQDLMVSLQAWSIAHHSKLCQDLQLPPESLEGTQVWRRRYGMDQPTTFFDFTRLAERADIDMNAIHVGDVTSEQFVATIERFLAHRAKEIREALSSVEHQDTAQGETSTIVYQGVEVDFKKVRWKRLWCFLYDSQGQWHVAKDHLGKFWGKDCSVSDAAVKSQLQRMRKALRSKGLDELARRLVTEDERAKLIVSLKPGH